MYNKNWLENISSDKRAYWVVIGDKISVAYFDALEADQYRNKYGDIHETREDALVSLAGGYRFGVSPI